MRNRRFVVGYMQGDYGRMTATPVYICGVANSGKTTLFNGLTGLRERVGNWCGVTTKAARGDFSVLKQGERLLFSAVDLPGSNMDDYTLEQNVVKENIDREGIIVVVCRAKNLKRGLIFLKKLKHLINKSKVVFVVNAYEELRRAGGKIDFDKLSSELGINVVAAECNTKNGIEIVKKTILRVYESESRRPLLNYSLNDAVSALNFSPSNVLPPIDNFFLNPAACVVTLLTLIIFVLYQAFGKYGIGAWLSTMADVFLERCLIVPLSRVVGFLRFNDFLTGFVIEGVVGGAAAVLSFLPRLAVIGIFSFFIEESGVLARLAYVADGFLSRFGLTGRAVFSLMTGFGCTSLAIDATGGLENEKIRKRTITALPFVCCSAKTPVFAWLFTEISRKSGFIGVISAWIAGLFSALIFSVADKKFKGDSYNGIIVEFTEYRLPSFKETVKFLLNYVKNFIIRVGTIITIVTAFLWILRSVSPSFDFLPAEKADESILFCLAEQVQTIFYPVGVKNWQFAVAVIVGVFAKENVLSALILLGIGNASVRELTAFMLFFALYPPCISALIAILKRGGVKCFLHVVCFHSFIAISAFYSVVNPIWLLLPIGVLSSVLIVEKVRKPSERKKITLRTNYS